MKRPSSLSAIATALVDFPVGLCRSVCAVVLLHGLATFGGASLRAQAPGTVDPVFGGASLGLAGNVNVVALQPDGKVLVGGRFDHGLVRLNTDGSLDTSFNAAVATKTVYALVLQPDGKVLVGGAFEVNAYGLKYLARLNADGSLDTSFNVNTDAPVVALALQPDGKIVIGGFFTQVNGVSHTNIARLNADGSPDASFAAITAGDEQGEVTALALQPDGKVLVGGYFTQVNGTSENRFARLNADGSLDASFTNGIDIGYDVKALAVQSDGKILIAGGVSGTANNNFVRLNADGSLDAGFNAAPDADVDALALQPDGKLVIGGIFNRVDGVSQSNLARLNADGSLDSTLTANANSDVLALALQPNGEIVLGGDFTQINGTSTSSVVRLTANGQIDNSFIADEASGPNAAVSALLLQADGKLLIAGSFSQVQGGSHFGLGRLNADGTVDASFQTQTDGQLETMALQSDGKILIGGYFGQVNGATHQEIARLNADGSLDASFINNLRIDGGVFAITVQPDGKIVIGGAFDQGIARLNTDGSLDSAFTAFTAGNSYPSISGDSGVFALALQPDGKIVVGGGFTAVNGVARNNLARLNADGSLDASFGAGTASTDYESQVLALALQPDGKMIVGGYFILVNGVSHSRLARLNADGSLDASFNPQVFFGQSVNALVLQSDGNILFGGYFVQGDGISQNYLARLNADGSPDPFFNPGGSGPDDVVNALALQPDGKIFVGGLFTNIDGSVRNYVARLNGGGAPDFFSWGVPVGSGFYYEQFPGGAPFGYYNLSGNGYSFPYFFHADLGMEYFFDANDGVGGAYLYDFASSTFFYTSPTFPWPYLYDFSLNTVLYYYPDPGNPGHYNTDGYRFFYRFDTGQVIVK